MSELPSIQPPLPPEVSIMEEGKISPSVASTVNMTVTQINAPQIIAELFGTYVIVFAGCGSILVNVHHPITNVGIAIVWGLAAMMMIYALGHVSGAHFNPAVTVAFAVSRQFKWKHAPAYIVSQIVGSILAILALQMLFEPELKVQGTLTQFSYPTTREKAFAWEFTTSFFLMFTACGVATDHRSINELSGVVVGATVLVNYLIAGDITGASTNPARSIGPALVSGHYQYLWIYIIAPIIGTIAATMVYGLFRPTNDKSNNTKSV